MNETHFMQMSLEDQNLQCEQITGIAKVLTNIEKKVVHSFWSKSNMTY